MNEHIKGRGAQIKTHNRFSKGNYVTEHVEGLDEELEIGSTTQIFYETPRKVVNKVTSPDVGMMYSLNPYQGCEHGCVYCYARNTHEYWGLSAGVDFESKIIVKKNAAELLEQHLLSPKWDAVPISLSGNTDCYQPVEKKLEITRSLLKVFAKYKHPVGIITKNGLILRDLDILKELAANRLVHVYISLTTLDEELRRKLEPRTASVTNRLRTIRELSSAGIPVGVMTAPIIPGLNHHEIPNLLEQASSNGAVGAGMIVVRLNGAIGPIFKDWLARNFPDRAEKVLNQISAMHGGDVNDSRFGKRMTGEGNYADMIHQLFKTSKRRYFDGKGMPPINVASFFRGGTLPLF